MTANSNKVVLFIGGFSVPEDGTQGGQVFACRSLLDSPLKNFVTWHLVDSTQRSNPPPGMAIRVFDALNRLRQCFWHLCVSRVDVVLIFSSLMGISIYEKGLMCAMARLFRKRVVLATRSHPSLPHPAARWFQRYVKLTCKACDEVICQSELGRRDLLSLFAVEPGKVTVVPNWIDTTKFYPASSPRPQDSVVIELAYVGWLDPVKGLDYLIDAMGLLAQTRTDFRLTLYGGGISHEPLTARVDELGVAQRIHFAGWIPADEVRDALVASDIFVFPSLQEGMPNSLLQAMACGLPVIATHITSIPELVEPGRNGILVPPKDAAAIAAALGELMDNPALRRAMGENNQADVAARFTIGAAWPRIGRALGLPALPGQAGPAVDTRLSGPH